MYMQNNYLENIYFCHNSSCPRRFHLLEAIQVYRRNGSARGVENDMRNLEIKACSSPSEPGMMCYPAMMIYYANKRLIATKTVIA